MTIEGEVNGGITTNVFVDGGKKNLQGKNHQNGNEEVLADPTLRKMLASHPS